MQFAHSGSEPEKQPPPHPALPYDVTAGAPHSTTPASPHSAALAPFHTIAPVPLHDAGTHRPTTPHPCLFATLHLCRSMAPCAYRPTGAVPAPHHAAKPHAAHSTAPGPPRPLGTAPELPEVWNKKVIKIATFLRLAIAVDVQITDRATKMKQNDRSVPHFHFTGEEKEPLIAKMLQKRQDFCFRKANYRNRSRFRNEPIAKGKSRDELIAATRRTPMNNART